MKRKESSRIASTVGTVKFASCEADPNGLILLGGWVTCLLFFANEGKIFLTVSVGFRWLFRGEQLDKR